MNNESAIVEESIYDIEEDHPRSRNVSNISINNHHNNYRFNSHSQSIDRNNNQHRHAMENQNGEAITPYDTSQISFPSDLIHTDSPFFDEATKPLPKQWTENAVEIVKIGNVCAALAGCIYFYMAGFFDVVLEYNQVLFLSILVNIIDSKPGTMRVFWFIFIVFSGLIWTAMAVYMSTWHLPIYHRVAWCVMAFVYDTGTIACAYVILHHPSRKLRTTNFLELDLLLYLITLNTVCIFPIEHFNSSLHMILDIRMIVLLYSGLYRPVDKIALLRRKSLWFVMICIIIFFVLVSNNNIWCQFTGSILNIGVGATLLSEAALFHFIKFPHIRRTQDLEDRQEQLSHKPGSFTDESLPDNDKTNNDNFINDNRVQRLSAVAMTKQTYQPSIPINRQEDKAISNPMSTMSNTSIV